MSNVARLYKLLPKHLKLIRKLQKRHFMSDAFYCESEWMKRLNSPTLKKVVVDNLFYEIEDTFQKSGKVSAVDIDIFVNAINDNNHFDEMADLIHKLRLSAEACNIFKSTQHSFIRAFLEHGNTNELLGILNDRLNYGIFPDDYLLILMMDNFIKKKDFTSAAKIGILPMLQEEFSNCLIKYLSLYSCHNYLLSPGQWSEKKQEKVIAADDDDEEEEVKIRVRFLRNPFFDDHFDLSEANDLIGKTFAMFGKSINDSLGKSYELLGLLLFKKWGVFHELADSILKENIKIYNSCLELAESVSQNQTEAEKERNIPDAAREKLFEIKTRGLCIEENVLDILEARIKDEVLKNEEKIIQEQCQTYMDWEDHRETCLKKEIEEINRAARLEQVRKTKELLATKEDELFFFDREEDIDLVIEKKMESDQQSAQNKDIKSSEYIIPPEIVKKNQLNDK